MRYIAALFFVLAASAAAPGLAEMSSEEYQTSVRRLSMEELARESARWAEERERAEAAERARQAAEEAERLAQEALRRAALPPGKRLVEDRCMACHAAATLAGERRGWLGWWAVLLRMELLNGARFAAGDRRVIVDHLAEHQGAGQARVMLEWVLAMGTVALAPLAWFGWKAARRRRACASQGGVSN
jgi:mono/diheme cytochrome c family protein